VIVSALEASTPRDAFDRKPSAKRRALNGHPSRQLSRITNHCDLLPDVDGNSPEARRFRDLVRAYIADAGGLDQCSQARLDLYRLLSSLIVRAERLAAAQLNGADVSIIEQCTLASTILRYQVRLGLDRQQRDVTPDPLEYARQFDEAAE
jgi:hypothetical protein